MLFAPKVYASRAVADHWAVEEIR